MVKLLALAAVALVVLAWSSPAAACSCPSHRAVLVWPKPDSYNVPTDTPLVVFASSPEQLTYTLTDGAGAEVRLITVRVIAASKGCGQGMLDAVFFRPETALRPGTKYRITLDFNPPQPIPHHHPDDAFITGPGAAGERRPPAVKRWVYANVFPSDRSLLEIFASVEGPEPAFLVAVGKPATVIVPLGPAAARNPEGVNLGEVSCAAIEVVDAFGETLKAERLCQPDRCHTPPAIGCSTCGDNCGSGSTWEEWQRRAPCAQPSAGCSMNTAGTATGGILAALLALALVVRPRVRACDDIRTPPVRRTLRS